VLDINWIRQNPQILDENLIKRGASPCSQSILSLDQQWRDQETELQTLQNERNQIAKSIGERKRHGQNADDLLKAAQKIKDKIPHVEKNVRSLEEQKKEMLARLPNLLLADVPVGKDEEDNLCVRSYGTPRNFTFTPKPHYELGENLGLMSFERATKISGSRFVVLRGALAKLERALGRFMLDIHTQQYGYEEFSPPLLVRDEALFGTGQLPKFKDDQFTTTSDNLSLIPTAEVPLTNLVRDEILDENVLPLRFTAETYCFRSEAGAAGRDTRGMIRQHQFRKVELVSITTPDQSIAEFERMTGVAESILQRLDLPYRVMNLCSGDVGFSSAKTYDLDVWLPSESAYREISSCSIFMDFQARRMRARYRCEEDNRPQFVHTLNGSGLAIGRTLVALLENYQQDDGAIHIPKVLVPYMDGLDVIEPQKSKFV